MQIKAHKIVKLFDKGLPTQFRALDEASANFKQGEFTAIIGQTGSGKTTFIEHLNSLLIPEQGEVEFLYEDFNKKTNANEEVRLVIRKNFFNKVKKAKSLRKRVGIVFQFAEYQLFESTVEKDIIFGPVSMGVNKDIAKESAKKYLKLVGLEESFLKQSPLDLSGGQKRRVAIAGILAMEPDFLILDEPTAGLDPAGVKDTMHIFEKLHNDGKTIIVVTHDLDNVLEWTQRIIVFQKGKIIKDASTYEVLEDTVFLKENNMKPPKIIAFNKKLKDSGIDLGKIVSIEQLANKLNAYLSSKKKAVNQKGSK